MRPGNSPPKDFQKHSAPLNNETILRTVWAADSGHSAMVRRLKRQRTYVLTPRSDGQKHDVIGES